MEARLYPVPKAGEQFIIILRIIGEASQCQFHIRIVMFLTGRISPSTLFICFLIVSDYFTVVQRSPDGVSSRIRLEPLGFSTIFCTVPVTPDFRVVNCEPTVMFSILLPFGCLISLTLS